jgi:hypothetical protein
MIDITYKFRNNNNDVDSKGKWEIIYKSWTGNDEQSGAHF